MILITFYINIQKVTENYIKDEMKFIIQKINKGIFELNKFWTQILGWPNYIGSLKYIFKNFKYLIYKDNQEVKLKLKPFFKNENCYRK